MKPQSRTETLARCPSARSNANERCTVHSLRGSITSLSALGGELSTDRQLARRIEILSDMRQHRVVAGGAVRRTGSRPGAATAIGELREELGRVERVLADIAHELDHSSGRLVPSSSVTVSRVHAGPPNTLCQLFGGCSPRSPRPGRKW